VWRRGETIRARLFHVSADLVPSVRLHPRAQLDPGPQVAGTMIMVDVSPRSMLVRSRTPGGRKMIRYSLVSVVSVVVSQIVLFIAQSFWSARTSNIVAVCLSAVPSYYLNRAWAWGKTGKSHLMKEIVPFWSLALLGLVFSTWAADYAESNAPQLTSSDLVARLIVNGAALAAFGILWVGKFFIFNRLMFAHQPEPSLPSSG
jgi:putative flippase GtrA